VKAVPARVAVETSTVIDTTIGGICDQFEGEVQTGPFGSQLHASDYSEEGIPVVMPQDMVDGRISCDNIARVNSMHVRRLSQHRLQTGDIVLSRRGDVSRFAVVTPFEEGWLCGTGSIRIRLNCPEIDTRYLRHYLQQDKIGKWLLHNAKGVTMPNLNTATVRGIPFRYPSLGEQQRIAALLDKVDALRRKRTYALDLLDSIGPAIFFDMFGDAHRNTKGFDVYPVGEICELMNGSAFKPTDWEEEGSPIIRIQNLNDSSKPFNRTKRVLPQKYWIRKGDYLFSWSGTPGTSFGCFKWSGPEGWLNQHIFRVTFDARVIGTFFQYQMNARMNELIAKAHGGVGLQHVTKGMITEMPFICPPKNVQDEFVRRVLKMTRLKSDLDRSAMAYGSLFNSLQHRAFPIHI
jgi:type I restriction enzyme, S subunit